MATDRAEHMYMVRVPLAVLWLERYLSYVWNGMQKSRFSRMLATPPPRTEGAADTRGTSRLTIRLHNAGVSSSALETLSGRVDADP